MSHSVLITDLAQAQQIFEKALLWVNARVKRGDPVRLTLSGPTRSSPQNTAIQGLIRNIGKALIDTDHDRLRMLLCEQWRYETGRPGEIVKSFDGLRNVDISNRTSSRDKADASEFIDWLAAKEAEIT